MRANPSLLLVAIELYCFFDSKLLVFLGMGHMNPISKMQIYPKIKFYGEPHLDFSRPITIQNQLEPKAC